MQFLKQFYINYPVWLFQYLCDVGIGKLSFTEERIKFLKCVVIFTSISRINHQITGTTTEGCHPADSVLFFSTLSPFLLQCWRHQNNVNWENFGNFFKSRIILMSIGIVRYYCGPVSGWYSACFSAYLLHCISRKDSDYHLSFTDDRDGLVSWLIDQF